MRRHFLRLLDAVARRGAGDHTHGRQVVVLLIAGGVLSILPLLGVWMLPLGLALLAEDVPALRSSRAKVLDWIERKKPHWLDPSASRNDQT